MEFFNFFVISRMVKGNIMTEIEELQEKHEKEEVKVCGKAPEH